MNHQAQHIYEFSPFRLDAAEHLLLRDGEVVPLTPKAFDLLLALVERHERLVGKRDGICSPPSTVGCNPRLKSNAADAADEPWAVL